MLDVSHKFSGILALFNDITDIINSRKELTDYKDHLEDMVQERTLEIKEKEGKLKGALKEKEILLKEIHHRVKNNLQLISSMLNLQCRHIKDRDMVSIFKESQNRIKLMSLIHRILYSSDNVKEIEFEPYIRKLSGYLFKSYGIKEEYIKLNLNINNLSMEIKKAVPCGLIVNELLSNSLKYAFPEGRGEAYIDFSPLDDGKFLLIVGDKGCSFPCDLDFQNTSSLGLQLVNNLVDQLEGRIELNRENGTEFKIIFPG